MSQNPQQSAQILTWTDQEGHQGKFQPYVLPHLPCNLWGRDVLQQMGVYLFSPNPIVSQQLLQQGLLPNQGLGKHNTGILAPVQVTPKNDRHGLGFPQGH